MLCARSLAWALLLSCPIGKVIWACVTAGILHPLGYPDILSLMDLGLIYHSEIESGELPLGISTEWRCAGQTLYLATKRKGTILVYYKFTTTGAELCKLVTRRQQDAYVKSLKNTLSNAFNLI